jgi:gliding motility-associated lipoprotein GldH
MKQLIIFCIALLSFAACMPGNQYQQKYFLPNHEWAYSDVKTFSFAIKDTSAKYNLQFLLQHTENYGYSNLWLKMRVKYPSGTIDSQRIEVPLALPDGHWLGRFANNMVEHTMNIAPNAATTTFSEKGIYTISLEQDMRINPMKAIEYVGLQIDKVAINKY